MRFMDYDHEAAVGGPAPLSDARPEKNGRRTRPIARGLSRDVGSAVGAALLATAAGILAQRWLGLHDLSTVYIVAVVLVAANTRMAAAVLAAVLCFVSYDFFFIEPRYTLAIGARQGVATVFLFLAAALIAGRLASRLRAQVLALRAAHAYATALETLGRELAGAADAAQVMDAGQRALAHATRADVQMIASGADAAPPVAPDTVANDSWRLPLVTTRGHVVLRFRGDMAEPTTPQRRLVEAMVDDIDQALVRVRLVADLEQARVAAETERLRAALLSSVSHDLRSPLAAIIGAAGSLDLYGNAMSADDRHSLLETVRQEGERLDRYIQNLLDMTRLGHGGLTLNRDWIDAGELIGSAVARLQRYVSTARFEIRIAGDLAPIWVHPALVEQALFNVLENAVKFSPAGEPVSIEATDVDGALRIDVRDRGPGIPEDERARIFDMFFSVERGDRGAQGTGLGLAITQGMVGAHGGYVEALPGPHGRGTLIRMTLPRLQPAPDGE
jgi:two-component system sensor histidine kinase KdpD